ncbi:MAG: prepilin-type N-terminal cleavage/methylation domain-containing protein [Candidatus Omnitrophica bacterium]|nr:prepilin-type N-terminal cleavage/methylation domain-containing protein [Candidatus Omnitrophota bacterium]
MRKKAFTFIELLVALTIFSIIAASIYYTFNAGIRIWQRGNSIIEDNQRLRIFFDAVSKDMQNAAANFAREADFSIEYEWLNDSVAFPSVINIYDNNVISRELAKVAYRFDNANGKLTRIQATLKDGFSESGGEEETLLEGLKSLAFEYCYESPVAEGEYEWRDEWEFDDKIPRGVKIKLTLKDELRETEKTFENIILIPTGKLGKEEEET